MPETTELSLEERVARLEQEVAELKQAKLPMRFSEPPRLVFRILAQLWGIELDKPHEPRMTLEEARRLMSEGMPENWASREIIRMRGE
jgi:hypothetical protein